jgi:enoyl-CoA hydratase/3-hydroxyacyl-CoA dehydrogenase
MPLTIAHRPLGRVAVIGSGQIGPDIALHFLKHLAPAGGEVVVVDVSAEALAAGERRVAKKIARGAETGAWSADAAAQMAAALRWTTDYEALRGADLVVEAASEDVALKGRIFGQVEALVGPDAVLLSNSSHLEPERIFAGLQRPGRCAVAHYFFPADRNPVVEVVPGSDTDDAVADWLLRLYEQLGKVPIRVGSRYGYAVDPIFEGIFAAACLAVQEGLGSVKEVDDAAREALGLKVGPFTAMNLTGGNPITAHGLAEMHGRIAPWYAVPALLRDKLAAEGPAGQWEVCGRGERAEIADADRRQAVLDRLRGAYLGLCFEIVDAGLASLDDLELAVSTALDLHGPAALANRLGVSEALRLVQAYAVRNHGFPVPAALQTQAEAGVPFAPSNLVEDDLLLDNGGVVRLIRVRRPKVLNALDDATYRQLLAAFEEVAAAPHVVGAVLSGFGSKAFISGADIHALRAIGSPAEGRAIAALAHRLTRRVETLGKPVVAAFNGVAFGGGLELALGCAARIASADVRGKLCGLPEVGLGILPAGGGTQRLPRLIGLERAAAAIRTGQTFSAMEALAAGIVSHLAPADRLIATAVAMVAHLAAGRMRVPGIAEEAQAEAPPPLPEVAIGGLSRAVDATVCDALAGGWARSLEDGLAHELDCFERICGLEDMRIGIETFETQGPRAKAAFVHG